MLAPADIPIDERLPQLSEILRKDSMAALFQAHLDPDWRLLRLEIKNARYYPGEACLLSYRLKVEHRSQERLNLTLSACAFNEQSVPAAFRSRPPLSTAVGRLPSWLPQARLALWAFPDDPGILGLGEVWRLGGALLGRSRTLTYKPWGRRRPGVEVTLRRYEPTRSCVLRYELTADAGLCFFEGKILGARDATSVYRNLEVLWQWSRREAPDLSLNRPMGLDASLNAYWHTIPKGDNLLALVGTVDLSPIMKRIAAAVAALHRSDLKTAHTVANARELSMLRDSKRVLLRFYPSLSELINEIFDRLIESPPAAPDRIVPIHGDLHCNRVVIDGDTVGIRDFENFSMGDPYLDVACFLARFRAFVINKLIDDQMEEAQESFLSSYAILLPWELDRRRLLWMVAAMMLSRQVLRSITKLSKGSVETVRRLLESTNKVVEEWNSLES